MLDDARMEELLLLILGELDGDPARFRSMSDIADLSAARLLDLIDRIPDEILPLLIHALKQSRSDQRIFEKLMGEHEEELRPLVDRFFERYMALVTGGDDTPGFNSLLVYLPRESFDDIALLQSREAFFKSQPIHQVNEFLSVYFPGAPTFVQGEVDAAWDWFWQAVLRL